MRHIVNRLVTGLASGALLALAACGTTYAVPRGDGAYLAQARGMFAEAQRAPARKPLSSSAAEARFNRVARRVQPVGEAYCRRLVRGGGTKDCAVNIGIDRQMAERNAYFTFERGRPVIRLSMPLLRDTANDDEVAFVIAHEFGHLIADHIPKKQQQQLIGALVVGTLAGVASARTGDFDPDDVLLGTVVGGSVGGLTYSQAYELESDSIGTYIADAAGYDAVLGARMFARSEPGQARSGRPSLWGTHPPDEKRLATVIATQAEIDAQARR